jgi:hypothetical protein
VQHDVVEDQDKVCNFDCVYCEVDRRTPPVVCHVDMPRLLAELVEPY